MVCKISFNNINKMKQLFFFIIVLSIFACQKQEVDCDNYRAKCRYIQFSFSDCTPNGSELGWQWDQVRSDTVDFQTWGCPEMLEKDFESSQESIQNDSRISESLKKFNQTYPSTCNCQ